MDLYHSFQCLTVLNADSFETDHGALQHLATLPHLRTLICTITSEEVAQADLRGQADCFPTLVRLEVDTADLIAFSRFFEHISSRNLQTVLIREDSVVDAWDLKPLFETLASSTSCAILDKLVVMRQGEIDWASSPSPCPEITSATLASLFPLSRLATLEITIDVSVTMNDEDLQNIATAWPNLHTFCFVDRTVGRIPHVTLKGLLRFASRLPLKEIGLSVDFTKLLKYAETGSIIPCPTLRCLRLCRSPILEDVDHILAVFTLAFPSLSQLSTTWEPTGPGENLSEENEGYRDRWKDVKKRLRPIMAENESCEHQKKPCAG